MLSERLEKDLNSFSGTIEMFVDKTLSNDGQEQTLEKLTHLMDVASQLIDHLNSETPSEKNHQKQEKEKEKDSRGFFETLQLIFHTALTQPESLARHYYEFATSVLQILSQESDLRPERFDRRFKDKLWQESLFLNSLMQIYLAWNKHINYWIEEQNFSDKDEQRVQFIFDQLLAALTPSNLPLNPSALKRAENTDGKSAVNGLLNWVKDTCFNQCMPRQIKENAYQPGKNLAITPGQVVFKNKVLELIQYTPQTPQVHRRPILLIPPQINKFYVFDLKQKNSLIRYLIKQELQMFVISWKNPGAQQSHWGLDTYVQATLETIEAIRTITKSRTVGLISACAGCLTTSALLGYLSESKKPIVKHHTTLVTALTPDNGSVLELFSTHKTLGLARAHSQIEGIMDGKALAHVFAWLRPDDLIWNYWVNNYLMGREPPPLDVLYWDNDSTNLPAKLHSDFLDMYELDVLSSPNRHEILGKKINYKKINVDTYIIAGKDDYLMPWKGVYRTTQIFRGKHRFVLSTSGHVQSVLRPPSLAHTEYYTNDNLPTTANAWLATAEHQDGTWWDDWTVWLKARSGALKNSPEGLGNKKYPALYPAPGKYILEKPK